MASVYRELAVQVSPEVVFDYLSRPENIVEYSSAISECAVNQWPVGKGAVYSQRLEFAGLDIPLRWTISRFEPPTLTVLEGRITTGPARLVFRITPLSNGGSRIEHEMFYHPPRGILAAATRIIQALLEHQLDKDMARLKRLLDHKARAAPKVA